MATAQQAEKGKSRGNGPIAIGFLDESNKAHKRVPVKALGVVVTDKKSGKSKTYDFAALSDDVVMQLAAFGLGKRLETYARNTIKNNPDANVTECADSVIANLKAGKMYTRAEGTGAGAAGRPFDYDFWKEVMTYAGQAKGHKLTEKQLEGFVADLKAKTPKDRHGHTLKLQKDPHIKVAFRKLQAKRAEIALKKGHVEGEFDAFADMF